MTGWLFFCGFGGSIEGGQSTPSNKVIASAAKQSCRYAFWGKSRRGYSHAFGMMRSPRPFHGLAMTTKIQQHLLLIRHCEEAMNFCRRSNLAFRLCPPLARGFSLMQSLRIALSLVILSCLCEASLSNRGYKKAILKALPRIIKFFL